MKRRCMKLKGNLSLTSGRENKKQARVFDMSRHSGLNACSRFNMFLSFELMHIPNEC
jgi:hypothetical protein